MKLSVVITTYRRADVVVNAIDSALETLRNAEIACEVVVVDDCSDDGTRGVLVRRYPEEFGTTIRLIENERNLGVSAAKNVGYCAADADWVIFLDSDDTLVRGAGPAIAAVLSASSLRPMVFFRCVDERGTFVGTRLEREALLDLKTYLVHTSFGEALTAINKRIVHEEPYESSLRGYEGLGCCRIIARHGAAVLSTVVARVYDRSGADRLSTSRVFLRRTPLLARGHRMLLREFGGSMTFRQAAGYRCKAFVYALLGTLYGPRGRGANAGCL